MYIQKTSISVVLWVGMLACGGCGWNAAATNGNAPGAPAPAARPSSAPAATQPLARFEYTQIHMGVAVRLVVYAAGEDAAVQACRAAYACIEEIESSMSDYRVESELKRLCAHAGQGPMRISRDMFTVLERAVRVSQQSGGAFDVTVGPLVQLWRIARKSKQLPPEDDVRRAKALVGWRMVKLDEKNQTAELLTPGMKLDFGGIAKGYAGDCALATLREHGIGSAMYEGGGDIVVGDAPPGKPGWVIELAATATSEHPAEIAVHNCAISTSGDTFQYVDIGGVRYSHIIDVRTGLGLTHSSPVTVVAPDGLTSDSLSKPACILEEGRMREILKEYPGVRVYYRRGDAATRVSPPREIKRSEDWFPATKP